VGFHLLGRFRDGMGVMVASGSKQYAEYTAGMLDGPFIIIDDKAGRRFVLKSCTRARTHARMCIAARRGLWRVSRAADSCGFRS
jgi:hypothetical protein